MDENKTDGIFKSIVEKKETNWCAFGETKHSSYDSHSLSIIESENLIPERIKHALEQSFWNRIFEIFYISDLHLDNHILSKYPNGASDEEVIGYISRIVGNLFTGKIVQQLKKKKSPIVLFGGDISSSFVLSKIFFEQFVDRWKSICKTVNLDGEDDLTISPKYVYAVLGNHEFWDFDSYEACVNSYAQLFKDLGIRFVNNSISSLGRYYTKTEFAFFNSFIVGGTGFAALNPRFNARQKIYGNAVDEQTEAAYSNLCRRILKRALSYAREQKSTLVVLTHNPVEDWLDPKDIPSNCVFFNGHTHKNIAIQADKNVQIIADNQVGYRSNRIKFKSIIIGRVSDPFAEYQDGFYEITTDEYRHYYKCISDLIPRNGTLEYQMKNFGAHLWVIKKQGYFGFFMTSPKGAYICNGGAIRKIGEQNDMTYYYSRFEQMVNMYLKYLSPLRRYQEEISSKIKQIGGDGTIHGCIVDIDFFNHIMVNPQNGDLTFYYSPELGLVEPYDDILSLITSRCPYLLPGLSSDPENELLPSTQNSFGGELIEVDLKHSGYVVSRRVNALQRLFDHHTLRDWNEEALRSISAGKQNIPLLMGEDNDKSLT